MVAEHDLEYWCSIRQTLTIESIDEHFKWKILVSVGAEYHAARAGQKFPEAYVALNPSAKCESVDKQTDDVVRFDPVAMRDRRPDDNVLFARVPMQQDLECRQQCRERRHAFVRAQTLQSFSQIFRKSQPLTAPAIGSGPLSRMIRRQTQHRK